MFTRQAPPLNNNLWQGGISSAQAAAIQNLLGQCRAELGHNGPVQLDHTRPEMRLVGPSEATNSYPGCVLPTPEVFPRPTAGRDPYQGGPSIPPPTGGGTVFRSPPTGGPSGWPRPNPPGTPKPPGGGLPSGPGRRNPKGTPPGEPKPGGPLPPEHLPNEPPVFVGPGQDPQPPLFPGIPNQANGMWFAGKYINIDRANRIISLRAEDTRRHAIFPTVLNLQGEVGSVKFTHDPGGNRPEFIKINIQEQRRETYFSVITTNLTKTQYIHDIDTSDPTKIKFLMQEAWVFQPANIPAKDVVLPNCCNCDDCDCSEIGGTQPSISFTSPNCASALCPDPSPEVCLCPTVEGTIAPTGFNDYGTTCSLHWDADIPGCYTRNEYSVDKTAHIYVTISCAGSGNWDISVVIYTAQGDEVGQVFTGNASAALCVKAGNLTGTVSGIELDNGAGTTCEIDLTFNP